MLNNGTTLGGSRVFDPHDARVLTLCDKGDESTARRVLDAAEDVTDSREFRAFQNMALHNRGVRL